jgi:hypothetical protein
MSRQSFCLRGLPLPHSTEAEEGGSAAALPVSAASATLRGHAPGVPPKAGCRVDVHRPDSATVGPTGVETRVVVGMFPNGL